MAEDVKKIEVDIGAAAAMLQASPELCAMMYDLIGGPALVEAHEFIGKLQADREKVWVWLREPDDIEDCSLAWLLEWMNRRPFTEATPL